MKEDLSTGPCVLPISQNLSSESCLLPTSLRLIKLGPLDAFLEELPGMTNDIDIIL